MKIRKRKRLKASSDTTPARVLYRIAATPVDGCTDVTGSCWLCGETIDRGMPTKKWQGANFTDQNKCRWPGASFVCEACIWACAWNHPPGHPPPAPGKKGVNLRLFSHLYDAGEYRYRNKADKPDILAWLRAPKTGPWFATVANTGQKHMLPWAEMNLSGGLGGVILFEEASVQLPSTVLEWVVIDDTIDLLTWGVTKAEILTGDYSARSHKFARGPLLAFEHAHHAMRGSEWMKLVVWLCQRNDDQHKRRRDATK